VINPMEVSRFVIATLCGFDIAMDELAKDQNEARKQTKRKIKNFQMVNFRPSFVMLLN
jgi:hypothetical protein